MDTLYISPLAKENLEKYCTKNLIKLVLDDFSRDGKIVITQDDFSQESRTWNITNYIHDLTIPNKTKIAVILAFAANAGTIQMAEEKQMGDVNVLLSLKRNSLITDNDFQFFVDFFFDYRQGKDIRLGV